MTRKKKRNKIAKAIRKYTGISFVEATYIAKAFENLCLFYLPDNPKTPSVKRIDMDCGDSQCCSWFEYKVDGPKNTLNLNDVMAGYKYAKEFFQSVDWPY